MTRTITLRREIVAITQNLKTRRYLSGSNLDISVARGKSAVNRLSRQNVKRGTKKAVDK